MKNRIYLHHQFNTMTIVTNNNDTEKLSELKQLALSPTMLERLETVRTYRNKTLGLSLTLQDVIRSMVNTNEQYKTIDQLVEAYQKDTGEKVLA